MSIQFTSVLPTSNTFLKKNYKINIDTNRGVLMTSSGAKTTESNHGPKKVPSGLHNKTERNLRLLYKTSSQLFCFKSISNIKQWIA